MSTSSQQPNSLDTLTIKDLDEILKDCTIDLSNPTTVADTSYSYVTTPINGLSTITLTSSVGAAQPTYNIGSGIDTITINGIDANQYSFNFPKEWIDSFPDFSRVEKMCKKYPGLDIAFRNFKVIYEMVKDDYDNPTPKK